MTHHGTYCMCEQVINYNVYKDYQLTDARWILVVDSCNHCLQVFSAEGAFIASVGIKGSQALQFNHPRDVAVDHNGNVFITDSGNHRIQVLNADLTYSHCFGSNGAHPGDFNCPSGIAVDSDGAIYVTDRGDRVQKLTPRISYWLSLLIKEKEEVALMIHMVCASMVMAYFMSLSAMLCMIMQ